MLEENINLVRKNMQQFALKYNRKADAINLIAVSKKKSAMLIRQAYQLGQHDFGENYLQEAIDKQCDLRDCKINWHYIGQIQSNKTRLIAENFNWVHSVDRLKIAQRLNEQRDVTQSKLNICLQINIDNEESKAGFNQSELLEHAEQIAELKQLELRGLMAIPASHTTFAKQKETFDKVRKSFDEINAKLNKKMDTLSMGMSNDMEAAIAAGSTMIRIGTAIFGRRD